MTSVNVSSLNGRYIIQAEGHATGSSEVCAAISGIIYALAGALNNSETIRSEEVSVESGKIRIEFYGGDDAEAMYLMTTIGLMQIAEAYPQYIEVEGE